MDHAEALERMEIAAAEPEGLERLMAGDTPDASALAGHLAGCPTCAAELDRLRRVAGIARTVIEEMPDPALKERTLAFVRANGVPRAAGPLDDADADALAALAVAALPEPAPERLRESALLEPAPERLPEPAAPEPGHRPEQAPRPARRRSPLAWIAGIAAALALVGVTGYWLGGGFTKDAAHDETATAVLVRAAGTAMDLAGQPGTEVVALASTPAGQGATGRLAFNGQSGGIVMVAAGLPAPAAGAEYGCWVEVGGERRRIGTMYAAGTGTWAWSGVSDQLAALPADTQFGVSLVPADGGAGEPVLTGGI